MTAKSPLLNVALRLLAVERKDEGISRLAFYNPKTQRLEMYSKDVWFVRREELLELYEGREGIVAVEGDGMADVEI